MLRLPVKVRWDIAARVLGLMLGLGSILLWPITGHPPTSSVMTFAAALLVVPQVVQAQDTRNSARRGERRRSK